MARPGLEKHVKFKRLVAMLGIPKPHARGYLETLWEVAYENGDPRLGDSAAVEAAAEWDGEPGVMFSALLNCGGAGRAGFIEESESPSQYVIHDLYDHAPEYVRKRRQREIEHKSKISNARVRTTADNGGHRQTSAENGAPPSTQHPAPIPPLSPKGETRFDTFWESYPPRNGRRLGRAKCARLFGKLSDADQELAITAAKHYADSDGPKRGYAKDPERFLKDDFWRDCLTPEAPKLCPAEERRPRIASPEETRAAMGVVR